MPRSYYSLCRDALKRYAGLDDQSGQSEELKLLRMYEIVFDVQMIAVPRTKLEIEPAREEAEEKAPKDRYALMPSVEEMGELFAQLAEGIDERCPDSLRDSAVIRDLCGRGQVNYGAIIEAAAEEDRVAVEDMASEADVDSDSLLLVARESLRPHVFCAALERVGPDWHESEVGLGEPECPVCGSEPSLVEEVEGRRSSKMLLCSFCGTMWPTRRPLCLFCDNQNPGQFTSMESGSSIGARADVCEACKMYVKVLSRTDADKGNPISLYIDSLLTEHLDTMLEEEDYEGTAKETFTIF
jgi:formate dehydrogenase accessory protein FdhE